MTRKILLVVAPVLLLLAGVATACKADTKDLEDRIGALETQQTSLSDSLQRASMLTALQALGGAGLHGIDEGAAAGEIPEGAHGRVDAALLAVAATNWPADLQAAAGELEGTLEALMTALETQDAAQVAGPAAEAHEAGHEFAEQAANFIKAAVGLPVEEEEEPAAGTTPEEMTTPTP